MLWLLFGTFLLSLIKSYPVCWANPFISQPQQGQKSSSLTIHFFKDSQKKSITKQMHIRRIQQKIESNLNLMCESIHIIVSYPIQSIPRVNVQIKDLLLQFIYKSSKSLVKYVVLLSKYIYFFLSFLCERLCYLIQQQLNKLQQPKLDIPVYYKDNFASLNGGAQILMKSSEQIMNVCAILEDGSDKYLYTVAPLPLELTIALKEEIIIKWISVRSIEMYSSTIKEFKVEGSFALKSEKWMALGRYTAENNFEEQMFITEQQVIRYIKIKVISSYGTWRYFTLTQVKVHGDGLFADAVSQTSTEQCSSRPFIDPPTDNLLTKLIRQVSRLEEYKDQLEKQLIAVKTKIKTTINIDAQVNQMQQENNRMKEQLLFIVFGVSLIGLISVSIVAFCYFQIKKDIFNIRDAQFQRRSDRKINNLDQKYKK